MSDHMNKKEIALIATEYSKKILSIKELSVEFISKERLPNHNINAVFIDKAFVIYFNQDWLENATLLEITVTAFHESRHAYQRAVVDLCIDNEHEEIVSQWRKEFEAYNMPNECDNEENDAYYLQQSIEIEAIAYSNYLIERLFGIKSIIPRLIKYKVGCRFEEIKQKLKLHD